MKIVRKDDNELHVSERIMDELNMRDNDYYLEMNIDDSISEFFSNPMHKEYAKLYSQKNNLKGHGILFAHGDSYSGKGWKYEDNGKFRSVQKWIDKNDGRFSTLILKCCNPDAVEIKSKKSVVLVPNQEFSNVLHNLGHVQVEIYVPKKGYLDEYVIEDEIKELKKGIENKICPYKCVAERDVKRCTMSKEDRENPKIYGYSNCLKCNGSKDKCLSYKQLKKHNII